MDQIREEIDLVLPMPKKPRASSPEVKVIKKPSEVRPQNITVPARTSLCKEAKTTLESLNGVVLEENQRHLLKESAQTF